MKFRAVFAVALAVMLSACGLNSVPRADEEVKNKWAEVQNQYQRRADLIPNLVKVVKAAGAQEKGTLVEVTQARAAATQVKVAPDDLSDPAKMANYERVQSQLTLSLQRLQEAYPELKTNQNYADLTVELAGTENRITNARRFYNDAVKDYNIRIRTFPDAIGAKVFYGAKPKVPFEATTPGAEAAPTVDFGNGN